MSSDYCVGVGDQAPPFWVWSNVGQLFTRFLAISRVSKRKQAYLVIVHVVGVASTRLQFSSKLQCTTLVFAM